MSDLGKIMRSGPSKSSLEWLAGSRQGGLFHPTSGIWILALDWAIFGGNALTLGLATIATMSAGFLLGTLGTALCQWHFAGDSAAKAALKGVFGGLLVGVPLPIAGSFAGTLILAVSGLRSHKDSEDTGKGKEKGITV